MYVSLHSIMVINDNTDLPTFYSITYFASVKIISKHQGFIKKIIDRCMLGLKMLLFEV